MKISKNLLAVLLLSSCIVQAEEFIPNGSIGFTQTFYGDAGGYKTSTSHPSLLLNYNFSPEINFQLQWDRTWNMYHYDGGDKQQDNRLSQPKGTLTYNYGQLGQSQVNWSSAVAFENQNSFNSNQNYSTLSTTFDFSSYIPDASFIKATQFAISPMYIYGWESKNDSGHVNTAALGLLTNWQLPENFSFTLNGYAFRDWYDGSMKVSGDNTSYSNVNYFMVMAWLNYTNTLYNFNDQTALAFNFIGGFDPYISSGHKGSWDPYLAGDQMYEWLGPTVMNGNYSSTYTIFALPQLNLNYQYDKHLQLSSFVQVKYSNQVWGSTEKDWRFQPQIGIGATYGF